MPKPNIFTEPKSIAEEEKDLSMLLLKLLYEIYKKVDLEIDSDEDYVVSAYYTRPTDPRSSEKSPLPSKMRLYDIWCETYSDRTKYWIRVQNGNRQMIDFGRFQNDGTCFSDEEFNYLEALYNLRQRPRYVIKTNPSGLSAKTRLALANLEDKKAKPDLNSTDVWNETRMEVFPYLKQVLNYQK